MIEGDSCVLASQSCLMKDIMTTELRMICTVTGEGLSQLASYMLPF